MIVYQGEKPQITDISAVIDFAIAYNPILAAKDISTITYWVAAGCDIEKDILPAMKKICEWKKGITSFNYFTKPITAARDVRRSKEKAESEKQAVPIEKIIQVYQWKRKMDLPLTEQELKVLNDYENKEALS